MGYKLSSASQLLILGHVRERYYNKHIDSEFQTNCQVLTLHVDVGVIYQTNRRLELYIPVVLDYLHIQLCGRNLRFLWTRAKSPVRVQLGFIHGAFHRVDAPRCTGCVKQIESGAQRESSMTIAFVTHNHEVR